MKKIGFFGGTFDPIHFGHINLALSLLEKHQLEEVIFCPAFVSPHKTDAPPVASPEERLQMVERALAPISAFTLSRREVERGGISFTVDTIRELRSRRSKEERLFLILGEDALAKLDRWKEIGELLALAPPLIGGRGEEVALSSLSLPPLMAQAVKEGWTEIPMMVMSSTFLRERLKKRVYCGHLVPAEVLDFIYEHKLYLK